MEIDLSFEILEFESDLTDLLNLTIKDIKGGIDLIEKHGLFKKVKLCEIKEAIETAKNVESTKSGILSFHIPMNTMGTILLVGAIVPTIRYVSTQRSANTTVTNLFTGKGKVASAVLDSPNNITTAASDRQN